MILQIIISNGILDLVTGILAKLAWELGFGTPPSRPSPDEAREEISEVLPENAAKKNC